MKAVQNEMRISFDSRSVNESFARVAVASFVAQLDPTLEQISDIKTAVSEAVTNSIVHGYGDRLGTITIRAVIRAGDEVEITISDKGRGIENIEKAREPLYTTCTSGERSGMGFTIMESFMDGLWIKSKPGAGTRVKMKKRMRQKGR